MPTEPLEICFVSYIPTKKNSYRPRRGGGKSVFKDTKLQAQLDLLAYQIPDEYRNLRIVHPDVTFKYFLPKDSKHSRRWTADPDGLTTTLIDLLVLVGVFEDDRFSKFNGTKTILPAEIAEDGIERCVVTITPKGDA